MEVVSGDNWSYKSCNCKAPVKSSPPTNQHPVFYRPDALPVAQPTVSKHWRENITFHGLAYPKLTWGLPTLIDRLPSKIWQLWIWRYEGPKNFLSPANVSSWLALVELICLLINCLKHRCITVPNGDPVHLLHYSSTVHSWQSIFVMSFVKWLNLHCARAGSGVGRIDPLRFLAGCRTRQLNQASSVLYLSMFYCVVFY